MIGLKTLYLKLATKLCECRLLEGCNFAKWVVVACREVDDPSTRATVSCKLLAQNLQVSTRHEIRGNEKLAASEGTRLGSMTLVWHKHFFLSTVPMLLMSKSMQEYHCHQIHEQFGFLSYLYGTSPTIKLC
jgi:hypothetical protein